MSRIRWRHSCKKKKKNYTISIQSGNHQDRHSLIFVDGHLSYAQKAKWNLISTPFMLHGHDNFPNLECPRKTLGAWNTLFMSMHIKRRSRKKIVTKKFIFIFHLHQTSAIWCSPYRRFIMNSKSKITFQTLMLIPCPWVEDVTAVMKMLSNRTPHAARDNYFKSTLLPVVHMLTLCFQLMHRMSLNIPIAADQHALSARLYSVDLQKIWYNFLHKAYHPSPGVLITLCNNQKLSNYGISKPTINTHHRGFEEIWF